MQKIKEIFIRLEWYKKKSLNKTVGEKKQIFLVEEFQLNCVEVITSGKIHWWISEFLDKILRRNRVFVYPQIWSDFSIWTQTLGYPSFWEVHIHPPPLQCRLDLVTLLLGLEKRNSNFRVEKPTDPLTSDQSKCPLCSQFDAMSLWHDAMRRVCNTCDTLPQNLKAPYVHGKH